MDKITNWKARRAGGRITINGTDETGRFEGFLIRWDWQRRAQKGLIEPDNAGSDEAG